MTYSAAEMEMKMNTVVMCYAPEGVAHASVVRGILVQLGIKIKSLTPERCAMRIGYLAGIEGFDREALPGQEKLLSHMKEEMLIFSGLSDETLDIFLESLKRAGVPRIGLKAIVTETNAKWTPCELYLHLQMEREQLTKP